jgi:transcriptional regulator with XRE-family HTH domain
MTQLALGNAAYLTVDHIGKIERGGTCPKVMTLGQIAAGLHVPVAHLFGPHGGVPITDLPDPLGELVGYLRQRTPEDSALALSILRQIFDR